MCMYVCVRAFHLPFVEHGIVWGMMEKKEGNLRSSDPWKGARGAATFHVELPLFRRAVFEDMQLLYHGIRCDTNYPGQRSNHRYHVIRGYEAARALFSSDC